MENLIWHNETRKVSDLIPFQKNPRKMTEEQVAQLSASIERFNLVEIPVIDVDNTIIAGHQRLKILSLLGRGEEIIDVRVPNRKLTPKEFEEYLIRSNKNTGEWDFDLLGNAFNPDDLFQWGFTGKDLGMPDFAPASEEDQGDLGKKDKKEVECPNCHATFTP
jgi:hypothetical protein